jgi:type I restriction enzyme S subunit
MSEHWKQTQLGKVCEIMLGQSPSSETYNQERVGLPFFQGKSEFGSKYAQAKTWCSEPLKTANKEDILVSVRAPVGEANLAPEDCCIGRGLAALRADQENLLQEFLWHQIQFKKDYLQGISQGSTFDAISGKDLCELEVEIPPIPEQKKIAEILSGIDRQITNKTKKIEKHQFLIAGILNQLMTSGTTNRKVVETDAGRVPENWTVGKVEDFFELGRGRVISIPYIKENPGPYPVFSSQSKNNGEMGRMNSYDFEGDYFTWTTDGAYAGSVFARSGRFNCTNVCGTGRAKSSSDADTRFAAYFLQRVAKRHVSYVGNPKLMNNVFAAIPFALPPIGEQREIAKIIHATKSGAELLERQIASLSHLKSSIASDLLSGRKRVSV